MNLNKLINYKIRIICNDGRVYIGELLSYDKYMNIVLKDSIEERIPKTQMTKINNNNKNNDIRIEKRTLGLIILRGEQILTIVIEDKPSVNKKDRLIKIRQQKRQIKKQKNIRKKGAKNSGVKSNNNIKKFQPPIGMKRVNANNTN